MERHLRHGFWALFAASFLAVKVYLIVVDVPHGWRIYNSCIGLVWLFALVTIIKEWRESK